MNLKLNENKKTIFKFSEKNYLIVSAEIIGIFIVIKSEDGEK